MKLAWSAALAFLVLPHLAAAEGAHLGLGRRHGPRRLGPAGRRERDVRQGPATVAHRPFRRRAGRIGRPRARLGRRCRLDGRQQRPHHPGRSAGGSPAAEGEAPGGFADPSTLLPAEGHYDRYQGSLTTLPCSESVTWTVMTQPVAVSDESIDAFAALVPNAARPIQPLNDRALLTT